MPDIPQDQLRLMVIQGLVSDILLALESRHVFEAIGEHAALVDASTYKPTFATFQYYAMHQFVLAISRLYDQPRGYPLQSAHGVLKFLREQADQLQIQQPIFLEQSMQRLRSWFDPVRSARGPAQTIAAVDVLAGRLPREAENAALGAVRTLRDKRIAHPEHIAVELLPSVTFQDAETLLKIPLEILAVCGAYLNTAFVDNEGAFIMETDAQRPAHSTRRVLRALGITPATPH